MFLNIWDENHDVITLLASMKANFLENNILKELANFLIIEDSFNKYQIEDKSNNSEYKQEIWQSFLNQLKINTKEQEEVFLKKSLKDKNTLLKQLIYAEKINELKQLVIDEQSIRDLFFEERKKQEKVTIKILKFADEKRANEVKESLNSNTLVFEQAEKNYDCSLVENQSLSKFMPKIKDVVLALQIDGISQVIEINNTFVIIKLLDKQSLQMNNQVEKKLRHELFAQWLNKQMKLSQAKLIN